MSDSILTSREIPLLGSRKKIETRVSLTSQWLLINLLKPFLSLSVCCAKSRLPLPLTVSCFNKIQTGFNFLVPAHLGSPGQRAVKRMCVCMCCAKICLESFVHFKQFLVSAQSLSSLEVFFCKQQVGGYVGTLRFSVVSGTISDGLRVLRQCYRVVSLWLYAALHC